MNSPKVDRRKFNIFTRHPARAVDRETVAAIDEVIAKGMKQTWIAQQLGVHPRTVMAVVNRTGAYAGIHKAGNA